MEKSNLNHNSLLAVSAFAILIGAMLSGPVSTGMVMMVKPQPAWIDAAVFLSNYHWIQEVPFMLGFVLTFGSCLFIAVASGMAKDGAQRIMANLALIAASIYAALISLNYIIQIAYVPMLVKSGLLLAGSLTMTNPNSVCWAIEMFGYLFQGIAFWLLFPVLTAGRRGKLIKWLLIANLFLSIAGAVAACIDIAWAMTPFGLLMFVVWNFVLALLMGVIAIDHRALKGVSR